MKRWNIRTWNKKRQKVLISKEDFEKGIHKLEALDLDKIKKRKVKRKKNE